MGNVILTEQEKQVAKLLCIGCNRKNNGVCIDIKNFEDIYKNRLGSKKCLAAENQAGQSEDRYAITETGTLVQIEKAGIDAVKYNAIGENGEHYNFRKYQAHKR